MKIENKKIGFTLVEMIVIVVILSVIGLTALPMIGSAAGMQLKSAANKIASDLEYAKSMAISRQKNYTVVFTTSNESYSVETDGVVITDPLNNSKLFNVCLPDDSRLNRVEIETVNFDSSTAITFDYLGSPYSGATTSSPLVDGTNGITIKVGSDQMKILVEPVTGYITIQ